MALSLRYTAVCTWDLVRFGIKFKYFYLVWRCEFFMEWLWGKPCLRLMNGLCASAFHMSYFQLHLHYNLGMTILWQKESMIETTYTANCKSMMQVWPSSAISAEIYIYIYISLDALLWGINRGIFLIFLCMLWNRNPKWHVLFVIAESLFCFFLDNGEGTGTWATG